MSFQRPPPQTKPKPFSDLWSSEQTSTLTVAGTSGPVVSSLSYVLERGAQTEGRPPMSFVGGQQHGPVSIGSAGEFRIDGPGVRDVHAYILFDGEGIYLCSADEQDPLVADGVAVPLDWTRVNVPCILALGQTRAMLRTAVSSGSTPPPPSDDPGPADFEVQTHPEPGVAARLDVDPPGDATTPQKRAAPPVVSGRASQSGAYRPRVPSHSDDESTVVAPDRFPSTGGARLGDDVSTKKANEVIRPSSPPEAFPQPRPSRPALSSPMLAPMPATPPLGYAPPMEARLRAPHVYPAPPPLAPPAVLRAQPSTVTTKRPRRTALPGSWARVLRSLERDLARDSPRRKPLIVGGSFAITVLFVTAALLVWLRVATNGAPPPATVHRPTVVAPPPAPPPPPLGIVVTPAPPRAPLESEDPARQRSAPPSLPTLERNAVDALNRGDTAAALALYRQLAREQPENAAFKVAADLLEQKLAVRAAPP